MMLRHSEKLDLAALSWYEKRLSRLLASRLFRASDIVNLVLPRALTPPPRNPKFRLPTATHRDTAIYTTLRLAGN